MKEETQSVCRRSQSPVSSKAPFCSGNEFLPLYFYNECSVLLLGKGRFGDAYLKGNLFKVFSFKGALIRTKALFRSRAQIRAFTVTALCFSSFSELFHPFTYELAKEANTVLISVE